MMMSKWEERKNVWTFSWDEYFSEAFLSDDGSAFFALVLFVLLFLHWEEYGMEGD